VEDSLVLGYGASKAFHRDEAECDIPRAERKNGTINSGTPAFSCFYDVMNWGFERYLYCKSIVNLVGDWSSLPEECQQRHPTNKFWACHIEVMPQSPRHGFLHASTVRWV
jgi:hypothetical protein